jgi:hypothetical protein
MNENSLDQQPSKKETISLSKKLIRGKVAILLESAIAL